MAETLREFLVNVKYNVDGASEQKLNTSMASTTRTVVALGAALVTAAATIGTLVTKVAAGFDELYYSSQRTNASVQNLRSVAFAVSQLGGTYRGAVDAIESFGQRLRSNPGYTSLVQQLGVATKENGKLRDTVDIAKDLAKALSSKPYYIQLQYMEALGLDEKTYRALQSGELTGYIDAYNKKTQQMGINMESATQTGRDLTRAWNDLYSTMELLGVKMVEVFGPTMTQMLKDLDQWISDNQDTIVKTFRDLGEAASAVGRAFKSIIETIQPLWDGFNKLSESIAGQSGLKTVLEAFAVYLTGSWLARILAAFTGVNAGFVGMLLRLGMNPAGLAVAAVAAGAYGYSQYGVDYAGGQTMEGARNAAAASGAYSFGPFGRSSGGDTRNWWQRNAPSWAGGRDAPGSTTGVSRVPVNKTAAAQEAYSFWRGKGLTNEQALGMVANEQGESGFNPGAVGDGGRAKGLYQHHPDRRAAIWRGAGIDMDYPDANAQREGAYWEMTQGKEQAAWRKLKETNTAGEAASVISRFYERPRAVAEAARNRAAIANGWNGKLTDHGTVSQVPLPPMRPSPQINQQTLDTIKINADLLRQQGTIPPALMQAPGRGGSTVDMNQKTEINVYGTDPGTTAALVGDRQNDVNGRLLRNLQGATK